MEEKEINWVSVEERKPPIGQVVDTKVDRGNGITNDQSLKFQGALWFFPDGSMYVYYESRPRVDKHPLQKKLLWDLILQYG